MDLIMKLLNKQQRHELCLDCTGECKGRYKTCPHISNREDLDLYCNPPPAYSYSSHLEIPKDFDHMLQRFVNRKWTVNSKKR